MNRKKYFENEIESLISKIVIKRYEEPKKEELRNRFMKYINNGNTDEEREKILTVLKNITWHWANEINDFIVDWIKKLMNSSTVILLPKEKDLKNSSSAKRICSMLANYGYIKDDEIVSADEIKDNNKRIILIDDFIGSGDSMKKALDEIDKSLIRSFEIFVVCYACHKNGKEAIEKYATENGININLINNCIEEKYLERIKEENIIKYIETVCNKCAKKEYKFGWKKCGAMVSMNGISPNNNISMIFSDAIEDWLPLMSRDINIAILDTRNQEMYRGRINEINKFFYESGLSVKLTSKEFKLLFLIYNCYGINNDTLIEFGCCNTREELNCIVESLLNKEIISLWDGGYIMIADDEILRALRKLELLLKANYKKQKGHRFC